MFSKDLLPTCIGLSTSAVNENAPGEVMGTWYFGLRRFQVLFNILGKLAVWAIHVQLSGSRGMIPISVLYLWLLEHGIRVAFANIRLLGGYRVPEI
jgi:hypothetical protein